MSKVQHFSGHPGHGSASKTAKQFQAAFTGTKGGGAVDLEPKRDNHGSSPKGTPVTFKARPGMGTGQAVSDLKQDARGFSQGAPKQARSFKKG